MKVYTLWSLIVVSAGLIGWDIYLALNNIPGDTISEVWLATGRKHPELFFFLGVLAGHLCWPQK